MKKLCKSLSQLNKLSPLEKGDKIALVSPASPSDRLQVLLAANGLKKLGYQPVISPNAFEKNWFFSGSTKERADAFMDAWKNKDIKALWALRGGYGSAKILDHLDFSYIANNPKILIGMSDISTLHIAIGKTANFPTFLGPNLVHFVEKMLRSNGDKQKKKTNKHLLSMLEDLSGYAVKDLSVLRQGDAHAKIVGGNLSVLVSLIGTKYCIDTANKILILEDVNEKPYRIDRLFNQLKMSGLLNGIKGLIYGDFKGIDAHLPTFTTNISNRCLRNVSAKSYSFFSYLNEEYLKDLDIPILAGFSTGHIDNQLTVPLNGFATIKNSSIKFSL